MSDKKMTAIEWLQSIEMERDLTLGDWSKAKEMEKEQIENAYKIGKIEANIPKEFKVKGEQYYKETYEQ